MKVSELSGALLDEWVARAEGHTVEMRFRGEVNGKIHVIVSGTETRGVPRYTADWAHGGPIIDRARMNFATMGTGRPDENRNEPIVAIPQESHRAMEGETHLIAAMRAYVASKFGDEVPDEVPA